MFQYGCENWTSLNSMKEELKEKRWKFHVNCRIHITLPQNKWRNKRNNKYKYNTLQMKLFWPKEAKRDNFYEE